MSEHSAEKDAPPFDTFMARSNTIWCSRCANQAEDDPISFARSWARFQLRGWTYSEDDRRVFCPQCSAETRVLPPADERDPKPCPRCGEVCNYDGWGHVHATGVGIGSCPIPPGGLDA